MPHHKRHRGSPYSTYTADPVYKLEAKRPPTATVQKIINEVLASPSLQAMTGDTGSSMTFAKETRDLLIECCVEFITMLSSEANDIAEKDAKKTIACEHITKALDELGFAEYVPELLTVADSFKSSQAVSCTPSASAQPLYGGDRIADRRDRHERRSRRRLSRAV